MSTDAAPRTRPHRLHRRPAQGRAARAPRRVGLAADRRRARRAAPRQPGAAATPRRCARFFAFRDFAHFIEVYLAVVDLIRTAEDVRDADLRGRPRDGAAQQVRYAELTCTPYTSVVRGIPIEAYTEAIEDARVAAERDFGLVLRWIYDIPGESGLPAADATLAYALDHRARRAGRLRPRRPRDRRAARRSSSRTSTPPGPPGCTSVPHAGETTGPETVWDALTPARRRADRPRHLVGAGPRAARAPRRARHPARGLPVVQHRDPGGRARSRSTRSGPSATPASSSRSTATTRRCSAPRLNREYEIAAGLLDLDEAGVADLARAAVDARFAPDDVKAQLRAEIGAHLTAAG